jgi:hypothetical protein
MAEEIEKDVPATSPWILKGALWALGLMSPVLIGVVAQGVIGGNGAEIALGAYGTGVSALAAYIISRKLRNPDHIRVDDEGFTYKYQNITFRVGWEDVEELNLEGSNIIRVRLHNPEKVAFNSLVDSFRIPSRARFHPFRRIALQRFARFQKPWPKNTRDLAAVLGEMGSENGYHIAIPVFESAEEAEKLFNEMRARHARWQPSAIEYRLSETEAQPVLNIEDEIEQEREPQMQRRRESQ